MTRLRPIAVGTVLQLALVFAAHYSALVVQLLPLVGTGIGGLAGVLASLGAHGGAGPAAKQGALAGGIGGLIGTVASYLLGDIPAFTIGVGTVASAVAGALGGLVGRVIGERPVA
ncbi:MAG: hypothetical protein ABI587_01750 [Gemmatimonadales bacterium]